MLCNFRFDQAVVEQRKKSILEFLYYCSEHPALYKSQCFVKFFEEGNSSPTEGFALSIEADGEENDGATSSLDDASIDVPSRNNSIEKEDEPESQTENAKSITPDELSFDPLGTGFDYLYDAAMCFSQAVQEEANIRYKPAFELYKVGIDKLLTGAKSDSNEKRKRIAKAKAGKYLERAEMLYENHIPQFQEESFVFEDPLVDDKPSVLALERPVNNLSRFKVIGINNYMMTVQSCADKKSYVLKNVYKDSSCTISLPQSIPFMIQLISFYKTENSIFLLLPLISGGLLWDYINSYSNKQECNRSNLEELFVDPPRTPERQAATKQDEEETSENFDVEVAEEIFLVEHNNHLAAFENQPVTIPSFETLSSAMDINDLMSCSQKLLQSVSKTLEKSQVQAKEKYQDSSEKIYAREETELLHETSQPPLVDAPTKSATEVVADNVIIPGIPIEVAPLPEMALKQWSSELIVAVNNLHKAGVICGDLNLDNLLLGARGHLMLTYFYQRDRLEYQQLCRLNPNAVKCHYVAFDFPLTKSSDWYSVGVLIYEIVTRNRFFLNHPAGISRFNEIQYSDPDVLSEEIKDLLYGLIIENPEKRLNYGDLIAHPFFKSINWQEVEKCGLDLLKM